MTEKCEKCGGIYLLWSESRNEFVCLNCGARRKRKEEEGK
jgi:ribosomal protein S27E